MGLIAALGMTASEVDAVDRAVLREPDVRCRVATITELLAWLTHMLRADALPDVARRPARAYGGRTMVDVLVDGDLEWLLDWVRQSFTVPR